MPLSVADTIRRPLGRVRSWNQAEIKENVQTGSLPAGETCETVDPGSVAAVRNCALTAGRWESGVPKYSYGASVVGKLGVFQLGVTAKRTGPRYVYDNNQPVFSGVIGPAAVEIHPDTAPAYWLVNLDARMGLGMIGLDRSWLQANAYNLFDQVYVGGFGGGLSQSTSSTAGGSYGRAPFVRIGAPRAFMASINMGF